MRISEIARLVWLNINQNKFKSIMTSIGIVVGAATIVMVIGIGRGGQMDIAEQFAELNAGAIDISYEYEGEDTRNGEKSFGGMMNSFLGGMMGGGPGGSQNGGSNGEMQRPDGNDSDGEMQRPDGNGSDGEMQMPGGRDNDEKMQMSDENMENENLQDSGTGEDTEAESETSMVADRLNQEQIILSISDVEDIETYVTGITGSYQCTELYGSGSVGKFC